MGRLAWYTGVSTALAAGVVVSAFNQRVNFYSACVYLAQSNLCLMILINLILFIYGSFMYGLQRLCYGELRPIEIEQLYEKAWFAITETCLAMTIFREEVGAWFLVMFVALLTGKVWGWIGDGRVEVLEQQPPANPRLFHIRLSISLGASILYDVWMMSYIINAVIQQARPNMMVMFLFEFAILTTASLSTGFRYTISLIEASIVGKQTHERLIERRREVREERAEMVSQREIAAAAATAEGLPAPEDTEPLPNEEDVDEIDIEVPGWEAKGQWILTLALCTDFVKLAIYCTFFIILLMFYGLPIHIMRDLFMTTRSFIQRLTAFLRYRKATQDMNKRYPDASVEDIERENTCIICREDMRPWSVTNPEAPPVAPGELPPARPAPTVNERTRPKKLPCGHVLHLGCLKSWLERQQVCPTCREPVVEGTGNNIRRPERNNANPAGVGGQPQAPGQQDGGAALPPAGRGGRGMRMLNLGPLRVGFGQANLQDLQQGIAGAPPGQNAIPPGARVYGLELGFPRRNQAQAQTQGAAPAASIPEQLQQMEQQLMAEVHSLQLTQQQLQVIHLLQSELERLRRLQNGQADHGAATAGSMPSTIGTRPAAPFTMPHMQRHGARPSTAAIPAGSADLPPGITIPEGWSLLPLQRLDGVTHQGAVPVITGLAPTATTTTQTQPLASPTSNRSNNTPSGTQYPDIQPQTLAADSPSLNATSFPRSPGPDQSADAEATFTIPDTTSSTTPSLQTPPAVLPNWGSSQLFSGPSLTANTNNGVGIPPVDATPPPSSMVGSSGEANPSSSGASVNANIFSREGGHSSSVAAAGETSGSAEERRRDKGKARAATVEDTVDETEAVEQEGSLG